MKDKDMREMAIFLTVGMMILAYLEQCSYNSRTTFQKYTDSILILSRQRALAQRDNPAS